MKSASIYCIYFNEASLNDCIQYSIAYHPDMIGLGPCFLLQHGFDALRILKKELPAIRIFADAKISDAGALESGIAFDAGADIVSVMGICNLETVSSVILSARNRNCFSCIDLQSLEDDSPLLKVFSSLQPDFYLVQDSGAESTHTNRTLCLARAASTSPWDKDNNMQRIECLYFS